MSCDQGGQLPPVHVQSAGPVAPPQTWPSVHAPPAPAPSQSQRPVVVLHVVVPPTPSQSASSSHAHAPALHAKPAAQVAAVQSQSVPSQVGCVPVHASPVLLVVDPHWQPPATQVSIAPHAVSLAAAHTQDEPTQSGAPAVSQAGPPTPVPEVPPQEHVPAAHISSDGHTPAPPPHTPALQVVAVVQASPSSHAPVESGVFTHAPRALQVSVVQGFVSSQSAAARHSTQPSPSHIGVVALHMSHAPPPLPQALVAVPTAQVPPVVSHPVQHASSMHVPAPPMQLAPSVGVFTHEPLPSQVSVVHSFESSQSAAVVQPTQLPETHMSAGAVHATHAPPPAPHAPVAVPATQLPPVSSQPVQHIEPTHVPVPDEQLTPSVAGFEHTPLVHTSIVHSLVSSQSVPLRHSTHVPVASQSGVEPLQSALSAHSVHTSSVG